METAAPTVFVVWLLTGNKERFTVVEQPMYWAIKNVEDNIHNLLNNRLSNKILSRRNVITEQSN